MMKNAVILFILALLLVSCEPKQLSVDNEESPIESEHTVDALTVVNNHYEEVLKTHLDKIQAMRKPSITIRKQANQSINKIGGLPLVSKDFQWPRWKGQPMSFLLQIKLQDLPKDNTFNTLPNKGLLSFYYDSQQSTWGYDPKDKGSWRIIYSDSIDNLVTATAPQDTTLLQQAYVGFSTDLSYPDSHEPQMDALNLSEAQLDAYFEFIDTLTSNQSQHQLFGHAAAIQSPEMDLKSQLSSNGIYLGDGTGYNSDKAKALESGRSDWRLLLQFDTDEELGIMWADSGMLYFWMKHEDIKNKQFDNAWMILQSY